MGHCGPDLSYTADGRAGAQGRAGSGHTDGADLLHLAQTPPRAGLKGGSSQSSSFLQWTELQFGAEAAWGSLSVL